MIEFVDLSTHHFDLLLDLHIPICPNCTRCLGCNLLFSLLYYTLEIPFTCFFSTSCLTNELQSLGPWCNAEFGHFQPISHKNALPMLGHSQSQSYVHLCHCVAACKVSWTQDGDTMISADSGQANFLPCSSALLQIKILDLLALCFHGIQVLIYYISDLHLQLDVHGSHFSRKLIHNPDIEFGSSNCQWEWASCIQK